MQGLSNHAALLEDAAMWLSLLMWPFHRQQQQTMKDMLILKESTHGLVNNIEEDKRCLSALWQWHMVWSHDTN